MTTHVSQFRREQQITSVRLLAASNVSGTYYNGQYNNGIGATITTASSTLTIDSVAVVNNDRVLLVNQTTGAQNGIYIVSGVGSTVVLTRSYDFQSATQMKPGYFIYVYAGTVYQGSTWTVVEPAVSAVGTDTPTFATEQQVALGLNSGVLSWDGGGTSHGFTVTGLTSTSTVVATVNGSTNAAYVVKAAPTTNTLTITFSADPGASTTVSYVWVAAEA